MYVLISIIMVSVSESIHNVFRKGMDLYDLEAIVHNKWHFFLIIL